MKQTNNAIKFLMAQYRAIFKSAYFKGLASAAVVAMGLSIGAAQANQGYWNSGGWIYLDDDDQYQTLNINGTLAGEIAGDALGGSDPDIANDNKTTANAVGGTLVIGNYNARHKIHG